MATCASDAIFAALTHGGQGSQGETFAYELAQDPHAVSNQTALGQTGAPVNDTVNSWVNIVNADSAGPPMPLEVIMHERFAVSERFDDTRVGCAGASKSVGLNRPPCGGGCGVYCVQDTEPPNKPKLQSPENVAFSADPGAWSVTADGTTPCACGSAQTGGGPGGLMNAPRGATGTAILPTSVFALAMSWPNAEWLAKRLVRAGIIVQYPPVQQLRLCAGARNPCLCSWIGPFLASVYRDSIVDWITQPMQALGNVSAGLNALNQQFEDKLLSALYGQAAWSNFMAYDRAAGSRKFLNFRPTVETNVRGDNAEPPPQLLAGNYFYATNGESGSLARTLSGPSRIYQNAFFQATGVRVGGPENMPQSQTADWPILLAGGASIPGSPMNVLHHQATLTQQADAQADAAAAQAQGTGCIPQSMPHPGTRTYDATLRFASDFLNRVAERNGNMLQQDQAPAQFAYVNNMEYPLTQGI